MELPRIMPSRATDMLIPLMMKFQMITSTSQTRTILILKLLRCLLPEIPQKKQIWLVKSPPNQTLTDFFLDQLSKDFGEDEKQDPNSSSHLAVIVNNLWQQNISWDKFKDRLSKYSMPENCDSIFVLRCNETIWDDESILISHFRGQDIILQRIIMQISTATSSIINVSHFSCNSMPCSGRSTLHGVNSN